MYFNKTPRCMHHSSLKSTDLNYPFQILSFQFWNSIFQIVLYAKEAIPKKNSIFHPNLGSPYYTSSGKFLVKILLAY